MEFPRGYEIIARATKEKWRAGKITKFAEFNHGHGQTVQKATLKKLSIFKM